MLHQRLTSHLQTICILCYRLSHQVTDNVYVNILYIEHKQTQKYTYPYTVYPRHLSKFLYQTFSNTGYMTVSSASIQYQYTMQYNTKLLQLTMANMYIVYPCIYTHRSSHIRLHFQTLLYSFTTRQLYLTPVPQNSIHSWETAYSTHQTDSSLHLDENSNILDPTVRALR